MACNISDKFPTWAFVPKRETNVLNFLNKFPQYDGRGIRIAILDSGVDLGASGLQETSDGKKKIIAAMDVSGSGDVDTSEVVIASENCVTGLTGRKLKIPSSWSNPSGKFHIGVIHAYQIYPRNVKERVIKDRKENNWNRYHELIVADVNRKLEKFNADHFHFSQLPQSLKLEKDDLEAQLEALQILDKKYVDNGPTYDVVVFYDGNIWRAVIDTSEKGNLEDCKLLGEYLKTFEYAMLNEFDRLNYCFNVHEEGNLLEIVTVASSHGTHVASIAAAYFPDDSDRNGIAPGAQIISLKIADSRLQSMETGSSVIRAINTAIRLKCDVINMSYGEISHWVGGRVSNLMTEAVYKHGIIIFASFGNNGPGLSTCTSPSSSPLCSVIGIGAYVSPEMMEVHYSMREKKPGLGYTWTSRGPSTDGQLAVEVCTPGAAIASIANFALCGTELMNGTSMASPHAAGCVCLLLSGLKDKGFIYSPYSIRRALTNTALKVMNYDPFSMGHGLLQVDQAFDHLLKYSNHLNTTMFRFCITHSGNMNGIYLREVNEVLKPTNIILTIKPQMLNENSIHEASAIKIDFSINAKIICDQPWVFLPSNLCLQNDSRSFTARIDPTGLSIGEHFTWIKGYDSSCLEKGPIFYFPVTVIISRKFSAIDNWSYSVKGHCLPSDTVLREFIEVPAGASICSLRISSCNEINNSVIVIHGIQLRPQLSCTAHEYNRTVCLHPMEEVLNIIPVRENRVLELALVSWWASIEPTKISYTIQFRGFQINSPIVMHGADGIHRIDVTSALSYEEMTPVISLTSYVINIRPTDFKIKALASRDVFLNCRQAYEIILTYTITLSKGSEITPLCPLLSKLLYESEFDSQLWMLFDRNKQLLGAGDAYPEKYSLKVIKGEHILKLQIRHDNSSVLEKLCDLPICVLIKLQNSITMDIYDKHSQALIFGKKINSHTMYPGKVVPLFVPPLPTDKYPKIASAGNYLIGTLGLSKDETRRKLDPHPFKYIIPEMPLKNSKSKDEMEKNSKSLQEKYNADMRSLAITYISQEDNKLANDLFEQLAKNENGNVWQVLSARLQGLDNALEDGHVADKKKALNEIIELSNKVIHSLVPVEMLCAFGSKNFKSDCPLDYKKLEQKKSAIIDVLVKKGKALCELLCDKINDSSLETVTKVESHEQECEVYDPELADKVPLISNSALYKEIHDVMEALQKWTDLNDLKVLPFMEKQTRMVKHYGRLIRLLHKQWDDDRTLKFELKIIEVYQKLGWIYCADHFERTLHVRYPKAYRLF